MAGSRHARNSAALVAAAALTFAVGLGLHPRDLVLYNHSPSLPVGVYVRSDRAVGRGAIVTVRAREVAPDYAATRRFDGARDRFIKRVAAQAGDRVCAEGEHMFLAGSRPLHRFTRDSVGRTLPAWTGCRTLQRDELLLLGDTEDSFDGRYWGPVSVSQIEGVWRPLAIAP